MLFYLFFVLVFLHCSCVLKRWSAIHVRICVPFGFIKRKEGFSVAHLGRNKQLLEDYIPINHSWWLLEQCTQCKLVIFRVVKSVSTHVCLCVEAIGGIFRLKVTVSSVTATFSSHWQSLRCYSPLWFVYVLIMMWSGILHFVLWMKGPCRYLPHKLSLERISFSSNLKDHRS